MTRRRAVQCCCEANPIITNCNTWQAVCFGTGNPFAMPVSCVFSAGTTVNIQSVFCCGDGGPSYIQSDFSYGASINATGLRQVDSVGGPCGIDGWSNQRGIRYELTGTISVSYRLREYLLVTDDFGNCTGSSLCTTTELNAYGTIGGCALCGQCAFPAPAPAGCNCGFNCPNARGWTVNMGGTVQASGSLTFHGQCCAARQEAGEPCIEQLTPYDVFASCEAQFRAGCAPVSSGCQQPAEGGCGGPVWGNISCIASGVIGSLSSSVPCSTTETQNGTATLTI